MRAEDLDEMVRLRRARDIVDREFASPLTVSELARRVHLSPAHFARRFRAVYGETPHQYLLTRRIERAQDLLRQGDRSVTEVCVAVGASSLGSFSSRFREIVGITPSAYRALDHRGLETLPPRTLMVGTRPSRFREAPGEPRP